MRSGPPGAPGRGRRASPGGGVPWRAPPRAPRSPQSGAGATAGTRGAAAEGRGRPTRWGRRDGDDAFEVILASRTYLAHIANMPSSVYRTSFSNWQPSQPMGRYLTDNGIKRLTLVYSNYRAGQETAAAIKETFTGQVVAEVKPPIPQHQRYVLERGELVHQAGAAEFARD